MISINYPLFKIPENNKSNRNRPGGGSEPSYYGDKTQFLEHKRQRVNELSSMINDLQRQENDISDEILGNKIFFKVKFHEKALSKSAQPTEFLDKYNIDVYAQKTEQTFYASTTAPNLENFRNGISEISLKDKKNSAYLSAITGIDFISNQDLKIPEDSKNRLFIYLHDTLSDNDCKKYCALLKNKYKTQECEYFTSNCKSKIIYGFFPQNFLDSISKRKITPIQKIEEVIDYSISNIESLDFDFSGITVEEPLLDSKIVIVDSGIEVNKLFDGLVQNKINFIKDSDGVNKSHGTMVGSRAIFGNTILEQIRKGKLSAESKIVDFSIMNKNGKINGKEFIDAISLFLKENGDKYKIYNLSFNAPIPAHIIGKDFLTRELDALAHKYDVLFVVSAGNHNEYPSLDYPECLDSNNAKIAAPADGINLLSVGSIADNFSSRTDAKDGDPSPFTRTGIGEIRKPEVVHYGGNLDRNGIVNGIGVIGLGTENNKIIEQSGTSFSAPLVSKDAGKLYEYLRSAGYTIAVPELVKALLIHSATYELPKDSLIELGKIPQYVGYGIPDFLRAINGIRSSATFIYTGEMGGVETIDDKDQKINKQKIIIDIPSEMEGKGKEVKIKGTLVYFPEISSSGEIDYAKADLSLNIYYNNGNGKFSSGNLKKSNNDYRIQWYPLKTFETSYRAYKGGQWEILIQGLTRGDLNWNNYKQPYALVISIEDISRGEKIPVYDIIKTQYQQYITLPQVIENTQRIRA